MAHCKMSPQENTHRFSSLSFSPWDSGLTLLPLQVNTTHQWVTTKTHRASQGNAGRTVILKKGCIFMLWVNGLRDNKNTLLYDFTVEWVSLSSEHSKPLLHCSTFPFFCTENNSTVYQKMALYDCWWVVLSAHIECPFCQLCGENYVNSTVKPWSNRKYMDSVHLFTISLG